MYKIVLTIHVHVHAIASTCVHVYNTKQILLILLLQAFCMYSTMYSTCVHTTNIANSYQQSTCTFILYANCTCVPVLHMYMHMYSIYFATNVE